MGIDEKIKVISENSKVIESSVTAYLDSIYEISEKFFDSEGNLIEGLPSDQKTIDLINSIKEDAPIYENLRRKLINGDFNLSLSEIALCGLSMVFIKIQFEKQINKLEQGRLKSEDIIKVLMSGEEIEKINFPQEIKS